MAASILLASLLWIPAPFHVVGTADAGAQVTGDEVWARQFGTRARDAAWGIAADGSGAYVVGFTGGTLSGQTSVGGVDSFVRRYDANGNELWTRQFGTSQTDAGYGVAVDVSGVYTAGSTFGAFPGQTSAGYSDAFVRKHDVNGNELWTRQFGSSYVDDAWGIAADGSRVYVAGEMGGGLPGQINAGRKDAFVRSYDASGNELWTRQFGSSGDDGAGSIAADASWVYVAGWIGGVLPDQTGVGGEDAFIRKYDAKGNEIWTRQFGTLYGDRAMGVTADISGVYVGGQTSGALPGQTNLGGSDAFIRKYDVNGNEIWTRGFGTTQSDFIRGVAVDASGVYIAGSTSGAFPDQASSGGEDAFVRKYDLDGNEIWTRQFGSSDADHALGNAADDSGVYVAGETDGRLPGQKSAGNGDAFVLKYPLGFEPVPAFPPTPPTKYPPPVALSRQYWGTFYYPWYGDADDPPPDTYRHWNEPGYNPPLTWSSWYLPDDGSGVYNTANLYSSRSTVVIDRHLSWMERARLDFAVVSWWGRSSYEDQAFSIMVAEASRNPLLNVKLTVYYELEGYYDLDIAYIVRDLVYIYDTYTGSNAYFKVPSGSKLIPVVFVYGSGTDTVDYTRRWTQVRDVMYSIGKPMFIALKAWATQAKSYRDYATFVDSWHQYAPTLRYELQYGYSAFASPGFWDQRDQYPFLSRDAVEFASAVRTMAGLTLSMAQFLIIQTFNEWHEGTQIEPGIPVNHDVSGFTQAAPSYGFTYIDIVGERGAA